MRTAWTLPVPAPLAKDALSVLPPSLLTHPLFPALWWLCYMFAKAPVHIISCVSFSHFILLWSTIPLTSSPRLGPPWLSRSVWHWRPTNIYRIQLNPSKSKAMVWGNVFLLIFIYIIILLNMGISPKGTIGRALVRISSNSLLGCKLHVKQLDEETRLKYGNL